MAPSGSPGLRPPWGAAGRSAAIARLIEAQAADPAALIEVLHRVQLLEGYLDPSALHQVACGLALPLSQVYGVASFYHLFRLQPPARQCWSVCFGTACFVLGAPVLLAAVEARLGAVAGGWELRRRGCLGACGRWPLLQLNGAAPVALCPTPAALEAGLTALGLPALRQSAPVAMVSR